MLSLELFVKSMTAMCSLYNYDLSDEVSEIYYDILKDYSDDDFIKATKQLIRTNKYNTLPKPAAFVEAIEGTKEDLSVLAWHSVFTALGKIGYSKSVKFEDETIQMVIENLTTWQELCKMTYEEIAFFENKFKKAYLTLSKTPRPLKNSHLLGFDEIMNKPKGYEYSPPVKIQCDYKKHESKNKIEIEYNISDLTKNIGVIDG